MRSAMLLGTVVVAGCVAIGVFFWLKPVTATVKADGGSVAVGGNVGRDVIINQFDDEADRKNKAAAFVGNASRLCDNYMRTLSEISLHKQTSSNEMLAFDFNGLYYSPNLASIIGSSAYATLGRTQKQLRKLGGDLFQMRMEAMGSNPAMARNRGDGSQKFETLRNELRQLTESHCRYLLTLDD